MGYLHDLETLEAILEKELETMSSEPDRRAIVIGSVLVECIRISQSTFSREERG